MPRDPVDLPGAEISAIRPDPRNPEVLRIMVGRRIGARVNAVRAAELDLDTGLQIDESLARALEAETLRLDAKRRALSWLSRRSLSSGALAQKLRRLGLDTDAIEELTTELQAAGLINDPAYAKALAEARADGARGARRIEIDLRRRGLGRDLSRHAAEDATKDRDEREDALILARKRANRPSFAKLERAAAERRLSGFLQRRGFSADACREAVRRAMRELHDQDHDQQF